MPVDFETTLLFRTLCVQQFVDQALTARCLVPRFSLSFLLLLKPMYLNSVSMKCELLSRFDAQAKKLPRTGCTRGLEAGTPLNGTVGDVNSCAAEKNLCKHVFLFGANFALFFFF